MARGEAYGQVHRQLTKARRHLRAVLTEVEGFNDHHQVDHAGEAFGPEATELLEDTLAQLRGRVDALERALKA